MKILLRAVALCLLMSLVSLHLPAAESDATKRVVLTVSGMTCDGCAKGIRAMLVRTEGVTAADVSYEKEQAIVDFDPSKTSEPSIIKVIENLGYKATPKK